MLDNLIDRHKHPVNLLLHLVGSIVGIWGLWTHNWKIIIVAITLLIVGHLFHYKK